MIQRTMSMSTVETRDARQSPYDIQMFYDGDCPLCRREVSWLRSLDRRQRLRFVNIAAVDFDPATYGKLSSDFTAQIHGRLPDGSWVVGVEVFRRAYAAIGFGWLMPVTRLPGVSQVLDAAYRVFARNRLRWTGRCASGACSVTAGKDGK